MISLNRRQPNRQQSPQMRERAERLAYEVLDGSLREDFVAWLHEVGRAQARRNAIVHSTWASGRSAPETSTGIEHGAFGSTVRVRKAARGLEIDSKSYTADEIAAVTSEIAKLNMAGLHITMDLQRCSLAEARRELPPNPGPEPRWTREGEDLALTVQD